MFLIKNIIKKKVLKLKLEYSFLVSYFCTVQS